MNSICPKILLVLIVAAIACLLFAGCSGGGEKGPGNTSAPSLPTQEPVVFEDYSGPYGETITKAASYANTVNGYYNNNSRSSYILENTNARLEYQLMPEKGFSGVKSIQNTRGGVYVSNTMDTFITMDTGSTFFAGSTGSRANLYDQGIYYYNLHVLDHTFSSGDNIDFAEKVLLPLYDSFAVRDLEKPTYDSEGVCRTVVTNTYDPYICFRVTGTKPDLGNYDAFAVTLKCDGSNDCQLFYVGDDLTTFAADAALSFKLIPDNEFHTYIVYFDTNSHLKGQIKQFRLDCGAYIGEEIYIKEFALVKLPDDIPPFKLDRNYNVYSDKIHENVRFLATKECTSVSSVGTVTEIAADTVAKFVVNDQYGPHYTLEEVDWDTAAYAGFDIKDTGIFGIILGNDEKYSGKLTVKLVDGKYVITQELTVGGAKVKKGGSIYIARRIYTDESHSFSAFLDEAFFERLPLEIKVDSSGSSKKSSFKGYNELTGAYVLGISGADGFDTPYNNPLAEHKVKFTATNEGAKRTIYIMGETAGSGCLECAVVLDANNVLLPVTVEACKNFAHDGEELFYTEGDSYSYGLSIFPMVVGKDTDNTLTLCDLYEQWGNYRLKQVSSIRFHSAYYHISLGVTETNCIHLYCTETRLPDHRGLSALYWADELIDEVDSDGNPTGRQRIKGQQPQHSNDGSHLFLRYTDADGNYSSYENVGRTLISSSGPTLTDITLCYTSYDGKVFETYRHVEMPDTDENRAYYEVDYEFLEDVTITNVTENMVLYAMSEPYEKFGYLDSGNNGVIENTSLEETRVIKLGDEYPYFDFFHKVTENPKAYVESDSSSNLSFILKSTDIVIGGKAYTGGFVVREGKGTAAFTLDLTGKTTFKKGDHIRFTCILMPWGSYASENDDNVRMVRENTLIHPVKVEAGKGSVLPDDIVPTVGTDDGKSLEFTISGGLNNVRDLPGYATAEYTKYKSTWERDHNITVVAKGFKELTVPKIYEKIDGEWVPYVIASSLGYDGYMVSYADDGTFTYSFVVTMTEGKTRTFKVEA